MMSRNSKRRSKKSTAMKSRFLSRKRIWLSSRATCIRVYRLRRRSLTAHASQTLWKCSSEQAYMAQVSQWSLMAAPVSSSNVRLLWAISISSNCTTWSMRRSTPGQPDHTLWSRSSRSAVKLSSVVSASVRWKSGPLRPMARRTRCRKCSPLSRMIRPVVRKCTKPLFAAMTHSKPVFRKASTC